MLDTNATVIKAELSPISIKVEYQFPWQEVTETEPAEPVGVKMKDGTLYPDISMGGNSMGYGPDGSDIISNTFPIDRIIDVEQVESLLFIKSYPENEEPMTEDNFYVVPIE